MVLKEVIIHTDGGCEGNPGPGGWAAVLRYGDWCRDIFGVEPATTNNRMELRAAIEALRALKEPCAVTLFTDSEYLRNGITAWIHGWRRNGWRTKDKKPVRNSDLWRELDAVARLHTLKWEWLKGHAGHPDNERCDALARNAIADLRTRYSRAALQDALAKFKESQEDKSETLF